MKNGLWSSVFGLRQKPKTEDQRPKTKDDGHKIQQNTNLHQQFGAAFAFGVGRISRKFGRKSD